MKDGLAPIGPDGKPVSLHHADQTDFGPLVEMETMYHQENYSSLHSNTGQESSQIDRGTFDSYRESYWQARYADFITSHKED